jgi:predicted phosphodiesterase
MKLAILADIHGNLAALETVTAHLEAWQPDGVVMAGDVINRGPRPLECLRFVQEKGWLTVRGNHEDYIIRHARASLNCLELELHRHSYWTYQQLNGNISDLEAMPFLVTLAAPDGSEVRVTHASMHGNRDGIYLDTPDEELRSKVGRPATPLFCVGHTHKPLIRRVDETLVVNVGAVGFPFDGDHRASYGQFVWQGGRWQAEIIRLEYDRQQNKRDFFETGCFEASGPLAHLILTELRTGRPYLSQWSKAYEDRILAGELTMEQSIREFLEQRTPQ